MESVKSSFLWGWGHYKKMCLLLVKLEPLCAPVIKSRCTFLPFCRH